MSLCVMYILFFFFFFKQKTAYEMRISGWSSEVCSSDLQVAALQIVNGMNQSRLANAAKAEIYGGEIQVVAPITSQFQIQGGLAYTHARYKSFPGAPAQQPNPATGFNQSVFEDWSGRRISRAPDWTANLSAHYRIPEFGGAHVR